MPFQCMKMKVDAFYDAYHSLCERAGKLTCRAKGLPSERSCTISCKALVTARRLARSRENWRTHQNPFTSTSKSKQIRCRLGSNVPHRTTGHGWCSACAVARLGLKAPSSATMPRVAVIAGRPQISAERIYLWIYYFDWFSIDKYIDTDHWYILILSIPRNKWDNMPCISAMQEHFLRLCETRQKWTNLPSIAVSIAVSISTAPSICPCQSSCASRVHELSLLWSSLHKELQHQQSWGPSNHQIIKPETD